jgi:hypothetical protein
MVGRKEDGREEKRCDGQGRVKWRIVKLGRQGDGREKERRESSGKEKEEILREE